MDEHLLEMEMKKCITLDGQLAPGIVGGIHSSNLHLQLESVSKVAQLLRSKTLSADILLQAVVDSGLLPNVINMLSSPDAALGSEASSIILNITLGTSQQTSAAVSAGAIPKLVAASACEVEAVAHNALLALGNIAGDSEELRNTLLEKRAYRPALEILADPSKHSAKVVDASAWMMESCAAPGTLVKYQSILTCIREAIPILCKFIQQKNKPKPLAAVVKALRHMCFSSKAFNMIFDGGIVPRLVQFCTSKNDGLREGALLLMVRLASGGEMLLQSLLDNDVIQSLQICITNYAQSRRPGCLIASSIAKATPLRAEALVESSVLPLLTRIVADQEEELKARNEAMTALFYLAQKGAINHRFFNLLVEADCVEACCGALGCTDWGIIPKAVETIESLIHTRWSGAEDARERLKDSDGVDLLRDVWLEGRESEWTESESETAHLLLRTYFPESSKPPRV
ncbi:Importin alpha subunit (Karyopherin alpha subunit) (Serine-rich RNA polymerase I suppressor protein) [Tulasnella sp. 417]|nr:Importin alpha subunit (Karyopherin alpha subunit) (Serine-rich RNA polymerase I suppressor protein) [Tulasnella sp. 417]